MVNFWYEKGDYYEATGTIEWLIREKGSNDIVASVVGSESDAMKRVKDLERIFNSG